MIVPATNRFIDSLSPSCRERLLASCVEVELPVNRSLYELDEIPPFAYFLTSGFASVVVTLLDGKTAEVGVIGKEGFVGSYHLLGNGKAASHCFVQIAGTALRMPMETLRQLFLESPEIRQRSLEHVQFQITTLSQLTACNALHEAEGRLARWLLMVQDVTGLSTLPLTQEFLGEMLGTRRSTVALVAVALQNAGVIEYSRGKVRILDRARLQQNACECYAVMFEAFGNLYTEHAPEFL